MIFARTRLNWQIHLLDRLITDAHENGKNCARAESVLQQHSGRACVNFTAFQSSGQHDFRHIFGHPKRSANAKKL